MAQLKNIIFDFGGVLLDIDYRRTEDALGKLMTDGAHAGFSQSRQSEIFDAIETGAIGEATFRDGLRDLCQNPNISDQELDKAWNALLGKVPKERIDFIAQLKSKYRIFLLSNTNSIHLDAVYKALQQDYGSIEAFEGHFERAYYSHKIGMRKPNAEIFHFVLDQNQLNPAETVFIDDSIQHIHGAQSVGLHTIHLEGELCRLKLP